eukprot:Rhum_TRINITY_DN15783_c0_g1::Rhum_TRINITY_DN15783_c0_g1_i1::g.162088::m.162088
MGKLKKTAKKSRIDNMYVSHEQKTMMDDVKMCGDEEATSKAPSIAGLTKGELQKRQHNEWKSLRRSLEELGKEKRKLSNKEFDEKREKKVMRKHMIQLKEDMDEKHKNELEEFDRQKEATQRAAELEESEKCKPKLSTKEQEALKNMFAHLL